MAIVINGTGTVTGISVGGLPDAIVDLDTLAADSVNAAKIVDGTVVAADIASGAVDTAELAADAVDGTKIADDAVNSEHIAAGAIDDAHLAAGTIVGKQTIWVPAAAITPTVSNGCADRTQVETTAGRPDLDVLDFDKDADEHAQFSIAFPKSWNLGTVTYQVFWCGIAATTGVTWALQGVGTHDNETMDQVYGTATTVDDDAQGAVEELLVSAESGALTVGATPADDDLTHFRIFRDVSAGNDDMAGDARLIGIKLFYTTDARNDA